MCICEVLTHGTLALRDSLILDMICGIVTCYVLNLRKKIDDTMTQSDNLDINIVWFDGVETEYVERDGCISHPMSLWHPSSWEGTDETHSPSFCDDDGQIPSRRG